MTRIGMWYACGPEDQPYVEGSPEWTRHVVVADDSECSIVENQAGQRFPVPNGLIDRIASRPVPHIDSDRMRGPSDWDRECQESGRLNRNR